MSQHLIRQLTLRDHTLSIESRQRLINSMREPRLIKAGQSIVKEGERPDHCTVIVSGWACRHLELPRGRRQILALHISGDFVDLHSFPLKVMDHGVAALTDCVISGAPHAEVRRITEVDPHLTRVLWLHTLVDAAIQRQWLASSAQRSSVEHAAHLVCEMFVRLRTVNMAGHGHPFELPITQIDFADALGITPVHVSRTMAELRRNGLFEWRAGEARILDWDGLVTLAEFDPTYLTLTDEPR